jgi:hypothetical protein
MSTDGRKPERNWYGDSHDEVVEFYKDLADFYEGELIKIATFPWVAQPSDIAYHALGWPTIKVGDKYKYR